MLLQEYIHGLMSKWGCQHARGPYDLLASLVHDMQPANVLELGTGAGHSAAAMMLMLPSASTLTTINLPNPPSGDPVGRELLPWASDQRLMQLLGDTRDMHKLIKLDSIDFMFMDSGVDHNYELLAAEWVLYAPTLVDRALVCVDDLDFPGGGVRRWWNELPYERVENGRGPYNFGVFLFKRAA